MRLLNTFLLSILFFSMDAQFAVNPDIINFSTTSRDSLYEYKMKIKNDGSELDTFYWMVELGPDWLPEWDIFVCDYNLCYSAGLYKCPNSKINKIPAGFELEFKITLLTGFKAGTSSMKLHLFSDKDCQGQFYESTEFGLVEVVGTSSTNDDELLKDVNIYPNPTSNYFSLDNDIHVSTINVLNINGAVVKSFTHSLNNRYNITDLPSEIYIIELKDKDQNTRLSRLVKE